MRIVICLPHAVDVFRAKEDAIAELGRRLPGHELMAAATEAEMLQLLPAAEAAIVWRFDAAWYARAPRLHHVFTPAAGQEAIEPDSRGRARLHFGSFHGAIMAETLLAMVGFMNRRIGAALRAQQRHEWDRAPYQHVQPLVGQVALIVGYGSIGRHLAMMLTKVGMIVDGLRRRVELEERGVRRLYPLSDLHLALRVADHVVCVLPAAPTTDGLIDECALSFMKRSAFLYNLGRGNAIDESALSEALRAQRIAGAFLDVQAEEPLSADSPLWDVPNLYLTPHTSAMRDDYLDLYFQELAVELNRL